MKFLRPLILFLLVAPLAMAKIPANLDEAEAFARSLIENQFYDSDALVTRQSINKMRHQRNEAGTAASFILPRSVRTGPDYVITVDMNPVNGALGIGHHRAHKPLQRHYFRDYKNDTPYVTQDEKIDRTLSTFGIESACIQYRVSKRRADTAAKTVIEFTWLPESKTQFGLKVTVSNLQQIVRADANIGSDAFHSLIDKYAARLLTSILNAGEKQGLIDQAHYSASIQLCEQIRKQPNISYDSEALIAPPVPFRPLTLEGITRKSVSPPVAPIKSVTTPTPPPPLEPKLTLIMLTPEQVLEHAIQLQLVAAVPSPTPAVSIVMPAKRVMPPTSQAAISAFAGLNAPSTNQATAATPDTEQLIELLFAPDVRLLVTKALISTHSVTMTAHAKDDWAAVVIETTEGYHLPLVTPKQDFPGPFATLLKLDKSRGTGPATQFEFTPLRLFVLRAIFELDTLVRLSSGNEAGSLASFSINELIARLDAPETQLRLDALPATKQWETQSALGNRMLLGIELAWMRQQHLVRRELQNQLPRYRLTPSGRQIADLLFTPAESLQVTRSVGSFTAPRPSLYPVNAAHFNGDRVAHISYRPDGQTKIKLGPWRGGSSLWDLFFLLTEPER